MNEYRQNKKIQKEKLREDFLTAISYNDIEQIKSLINQGQLLIIIMNYHLKVQFAQKI